MSDRIWVEITDVCGHIGFILSTLANFTVLTLLIVRPTKALGTYKYLMIIFCIFSWFYTLVETFMRPLIHMYDNTLFVMQRKRFQYSDLTARTLSGIYCGCYAMSFTLIAVHFVYRYFATCKPENLRFFRGFKFVLWLLGALSVAAFWGMVTFSLFAENDRTRRSFHYFLKKSYDLDPSWVSNVPYSYWPAEEKGDVGLNYVNILGIFQHGAIMTFSFSTVYYCGRQTHKTIKAHKGVSDRTRELQNQLFNALVLQTLIPTVMMYIPTTMLIVFPFLELNVGCYGNITTVTVQMYPGIDPLVLLFLIKDFRQTFLRIVCLGRDAKRNVSTTAMISYQLSSGNV
uniref:Serpentine receptor class r-10 n=1 Tax=Caenorhabditis japonica TaxID=281687 RepID=A0A8R1E088_CAEJA